MRWRSSRRRHSPAAPTSRSGSRHAVVRGEWRSDRSRPLSRSDRAAEPYRFASRAGPPIPAVRRVASPGEPAGRVAGSTADSPRDAHRNRDGRFRRARSGRAPGHRREGAQWTLETRDDLTAQERQIALLAREGRSNPKIGARLFVSPRTVEWHLRNVFGKLGIRSRRELATALDNPETAMAQD
ncbi:helix-turn-helix transcriptional regulator [Kribbella sp. NPDC050820]